MELVRSLLLEIEAQYTAVLEQIPDIPSFSREIVVEHTRLLLEAGMIDAIDVSDADGDDYISLRLTWHGHDFVNSVRDPEIWKKTKTSAKSVGAWTITLVADLAKGFVKQKAIELGLPIV